MTAHGNMLEKMVPTMQLTNEQAAGLAPDHPVFVVLQRLDEIERRMKIQDPEISTHLKEIWKVAHQYEDIAHLLSPEQIGVLMKGLQKHAGIQLVTESKPSSRKSKKVSADDLI